ncbi:hypothetical protein niasHS_003605 [Heterodera schachtii]|uniref:THO complex subunit 3 n=1 Tax=Heterodera schachtii TaxID=97005 RepID=A0ABD2KH07_HETSC
MSASREIIATHGKEITADDHFRSANGAKEFFKRKDRSKSYEMNNVSGVRTISWNASGTYLASGSDNRVVSVGSLDPHSCRLKQIFVGYGHEDIVEAIEFAKRDEMKMASCSSDKSVRLWDLRNPSSHTKLSTPGANLFVTWSYCDNFIIFGDKSDNLGVIDARAMKTLELFTFKDEINEFVCHPNGQLIFVATDLGKLEVLRFLVVGASDACCSVWDINDLICVQTLTRLDYPVRSVSFSHCSNLIASGSEDRVIDISWTPTGEKVAEVPIATECYDVAWHPRLYLLAYAISGGLNDNRSDRSDQSTLRVFGYSGGI